MTGMSLPKDQYNPNGVSKNDLPLLPKAAPVLAAYIRIHPEYPGKSPASHSSNA